MTASKNKKARKFYYCHNDVNGLMVIVDKIRGTGIVKSYGVGHTTKLDLLLRRQAKVESIHPADQLYLTVYDSSTTTGIAMQTLSTEKLPGVLKVLAEYWNATGIEVGYHRLFALISSYKKNMKRKDVPLIKKLKYLTLALECDADSTGTDIIGYAIQYSSHPKLKREDFTELMDMKISDIVKRLNKNAS